MDPQANSAERALEQKIYRVTGKNMARDRNRPHGLTHIWMVMMIPQTYLYKIRFNINHPSIPRSSSGLFPTGLPTKTLNIFSPMFATSPPLLSSLISSSM
jgi:hypothetical protein